MAEELEYALPDDITQLAHAMLETACEREKRPATAESCTARGCFPRVVSSDPRAPRIEELKRARRKLMKKSRFDKCVRQEIQQIEEQARQLLIEGAREADGSVR